MLKMSAATLLAICRAGRPDMISMYPHGPVAAFTICPNDSRTVTEAPLVNPGPNIARSSRENTMRTMNAGNARRKIQLVTKM